MADVIGLHALKNWGSLKADRVRIELDTSRADRTLSPSQYNVSKDSSSSLES
jgi:hypothetical protein